MKGNVGEERNGEERRGGEGGLVKEIVGAEEWVEKAMKGRIWKGKERKVGRREIGKGGGGQKDVRKRVKGE